MPMMYFLTSFDVTGLNLEKQFPAPQPWWNGQPYEREISVGKTSIKETNGKGHIYH